MRDYFHIDETGQKATPIAEISDSDLFRLLDEGFEVSPDTTFEAVRERLLLEIDIRTMGLRL